MRRLINIIICITFLYSCNTEKKNLGFKSSYKMAKLNHGIEELIHQYLEYSPKLEKNNFAIGLAVHHYTEDHYMIILDNFPKSQMGYDQKFQQTWKLCKIKGFMIYVYDIENEISKPINKKMTVYYEKLNDSIIPSGYEGNNWELHFRNDTLTEIYLGWTPKSINEKIERNIRLINFNAISNKSIP